MYNIAQIIYYGSAVTVFVLLAITVFFIKNKKYLISIILFTFTFILFWSRFVEPQIITVKNIYLGSAENLKVALISDLHIGIYKDKNYLEKLVSKINKLNPDLVLIAGDFIYFSNNPYDDLQALSKINAPAFAVLGNHDISQSGIYMKNKVLDTLSKNKIQVLENQKAEFNSLQIIGLGELWENNADLRILNKINSEQPVLLLVHNPDITLMLPELPTIKNLIILSGHTHCGQIRIPFLYKYVIPTKGSFPYGGLYKLNNGANLIISCGTGEIGLPMRFLNPPQIILIHL